MYIASWLLTDRTTVLSCCLASEFRSDRNRSNVKRQATERVFQIGSSLSVGDQRLFAQALLVIANSTIALVTQFGINAPRIEKHGLCPTKPYSLSLLVLNWRLFCSEMHGRRRTLQFFFPSTSTFVQNH